MRNDIIVMGIDLPVPFELAGFSGAPIVDVNGKVVGAVSGGYEDEELGKFLIFAAPTEVLSKWL